MKRTLAILTALLALITASARTVVRTDGPGWYSHAGTTFYSDGGIVWDSTGHHSRNYLADYKCFAVGSNGRIEGDPVPLGVALHEVDQRSLSNTGREFVGEEFSPSRSEQTFWLETPGIAPGSTATVRVRMAHAGVLSGSAEVRVNGEYIGRIDIPGRNSSLFAVARTGEWTYVASGSGRVSVQINYRAGDTNGYLDWIEINYDDRRTSTPPESVKEAAVVGDIASDRLHRMGGADIVIITVDDFIHAADRLGRIHQAYDGMTYEVVTQQQIFDEYSVSTPSIAAYRLFLSQMATQGTRYVTLLGDGCFDNRAIQANTWPNKQINRLITYQSEESYSEGNSYCTDDYFGMAHDGHDIRRDTMNLAVGRITAYTEAQAEAYVGKVEAYIANSDLGEWKNRAIFMADDGDNNEHARGADTVANLTARVYPELLTRKLYFDSYRQEVSAAGESYPALKRELDDYIDRGVLMINYMGHGGYANLSNEQIVSYTDLTTMRNRRLPLWVTGTCNFSRFDDVKDSGGELLLLNPDGGAIALVSTTRTVYSGQNMGFNLELTRRLLQPGMTIGEAARQAKNARARLGDSNRLCFLVLGDPALRLNYARDRRVLCLSDADTVGALDVATLRGEVTDESGAVDEQFDGYVHITVFDKEETVRTLCNDNPAGRPFEYRYRTNPIYTGRVAVERGRFRTSFVVPKDIRYSYGTARVVMYAWDEARGLEGNGCNEQIVIGGASSRAVEDTVGPELALSLNTLAIEDEYTVGRDALLIARMSDDNGINTVGSGIGHDIMMWLDDSEGVVLNNYYESDLGSYLSGRVHYWLRDLAPGPHTLSLRCWDMANNSTRRTIRFRVDEQHDVAINDIQVVPNPATEYADIIITDDGPEREHELTVTIYDNSGRAVWQKHETRARSEAGEKLVVRWDLAGADAAGVYFARVRLGRSSAKTAKILVHKQ